MIGRPIGVDESFTVLIEYREVAGHDHKEALPMSIALAFQMRVYIDPAADNEARHPLTGLRTQYMNR